GRREKLVFEWAFIGKISCKAQSARGMVSISPMRIKSSAHAVLLDGRSSYARLLLDTGCAAEAMCLAQAALATHEMTSGPNHLDQGLKPASLPMLSRPSTAARRQRRCAPAMESTFDATGCAGPPCRHRPTLMAGRPRHPKPNSTAAAQPISYCR